MAGIFLLGSPPSYIGSGNLKPGAMSFWSVTRAYNAAYATALGPAVDLVDQAGANQTTINFLATGSINVAAINAWVAANSVTAILVKKLYDQVGGFHCSQATAANMPILRLSHEALGNSAIPSMEFLTSANQMLVSGATGLNSATGTMSVIARQSSIVNTYAGINYGGIMQMSGSGPGLGFAPSNGVTVCQGSLPQVRCYNEHFQSIQGVFNGASSIAYVNDVSRPMPTTSGTTALGSPFTIGKLFGSYALTGHICEIRFDTSLWSAGDIASDYASQSAYYFNRVVHEGFVAGRNRYWPDPDNVNGYAQSRTAHFATDNITALRTVMSVPGGGNPTITQSVEYPAGVFTQIKWLSASSITTGNSGPSICSDYAAVTIPNGSQFWVRTYYADAAAFHYHVNNRLNSFLGEAMEFSTSPLTDKTMSGTIVNAGGNTAIMPPHGIVGLTSNVSVAIVGDSIAAGLSDTSEDTSASASGYNGVFGYVTRMINAQGKTFANFAVSSNTAQNAIVTPLFGFGSHLVCELGVNDLYNSRTSVQLITDLQALIAQPRPGQKVIQATITPETTGSWGSLVAQTIKSGNTERVTFNTAVRGGTTGLPITGIIDTASMAEDSLNSGKWAVSPAPPYTNDGIHPNTAGHALIVAGATLPTLTWP